MNYTPEDDSFNHRGWQIKVLYDHACPMCRREALWIKRRDTRGKIELEDISSSGFQAERYGLDQATVEGTIHGILPDGSVVTGVEVFRRMYAAVGLGWVLAPTRWPLLRPLANRAYRLFARYRVRVGAAIGRDCDGGNCRMP
jgi:predicted DCC family thiol-disulfide oxidoreductase YuxK